jgi:hypothetical protein
MKTKEQLSEELRCTEVTKQERVTSDKLYAIKLVEVIVFGMVSLILTAVAVAWIALVVRK